MLCDMSDITYLFGPRVLSFPQGFITPLSLFGKNCVLAGFQSSALVISLSCVALEQSDRRRSSAVNINNRPRI